MIGWFGVGGGRAEIGWVRMGSDGKTLWINGGGTGSGWLEMGSGATL